MDGLSGGASIIAVVSLAIQLLDTVREVRGFLRNVSDAPKELARLIDLLEQLELIVENIRMLMERQRQRNGHMDDGICASVHRALKTCETKLAILDELVEKAKTTSEGRNKVVRSWGSLRLACKKKDIEEFETQLQHSLKVLDLTMSINLTAVHSQTRDGILQASTAISGQMAVLCQEIKASPTNSQHNNDAKSVIPRKKQPASKLGVSRLSSIRTCKTLFGTITIRRRRRRRQCSDECSLGDSEAIELVSMPAFLSRCIEFQYSSLFGVVASAMRTYPVIPNYHPAWKMCVTGDVLGLRTCFSAGSLSPYSVNGNGNTFLHIAMLQHNYKISELLIQQGVKTDVRNDSGNLPGTFFGLQAFLFSEVSLDSFMNCCHLLDTNSSDMSEACPNLFLMSCPLSVLKSVIDLCVTEYNANEYFYSPLEAVAKSVLLSYRQGTYAAKDYHFGKTLIRKLIGLGASVHHCVDYEGRSILDWLMTWDTDDPFESMFLGSFWLDALSDAGVDILEYMRKEITLSKQTPFFRRWGRKRALVYTPRKPLEVSWDWYYDPKGPAFDVLKEFKYFAQAYKMWKNRPEMHYWPFSFPRWYWDDKDDERFKRRQRKKAAKLMRAQVLGKKELRMPGGWIH